MRAAGPARAGWPRRTWTGSRSPAPRGDVRPERPECPPAHPGQRSSRASSARRRRGSVARRDSPADARGPAAAGTPAPPRSRAAGWRLSSEDFELSAGAAHLEGRIGTGCHGGGGRAARGAACSCARPMSRSSRRCWVRARCARSAWALHAPHRRTHRERRSSSCTARSRADGEFLAGEGSHGTLELRDAALAARRCVAAGSRGSPRASSGTARRCARTSPRRTAARSRSADAQAQWDARGVHALRASAQLRGRVPGRCSQWLRERPQLGGSAPFVSRPGLSRVTRSSTSTWCCRGPRRRARRRACASRPRCRAHACVRCRACRRSSRCTARSCSRPPICSARRSWAAGSGAR